ncbi:unnamed protein product [Cladocopium goreaui]|uniref:Gramicidin S biosynthesis protein GrsT n=1 Tax=Cladocopium goreaui TaxID=2562237 RepID=A0A9P1FJT3_9DINO|nr:unnamed protein product [Cladocopium goreaui]
MLRFKSGLSGWSQRADPRPWDVQCAAECKGFHTLPPTPLRRLQKELPPDTVELLGLFIVPDRGTERLVLHGLKGELLMGPDVVSLKVHISQIKKRLEVHARNEVIKGRLSRALQLYSFIALGAVPWNKVHGRLIWRLCLSVLYSSLCDFMRPVSCPSGIQPLRWFTFCTDAGPWTTWRLEVHASLIVE